MKLLAINSTVKVNLVSFDAEQQCDGAWVCTGSKTVTYVGRVVNQTPTELHVDIKEDFEEPERTLIFKNINGQWIAKDTDIDEMCWLKF
jgi:hypothetical protein